MFSNIEVNPRPDEKNEGGIIVEIKLKELEQKSAEVSTEWSIVPGRGGGPTLVYMHIELINLHFLRILEEMHHFSIKLLIDCSLLPNYVLLLSRLQFNLVGLFLLNIGIFKG